MIPLQVLLALGANLPFGDLPLVETLHRALDRLETVLNAQIQRSGLYRTAAFPAGSGPDFVNAAALATLSAPLEPDQVLALLHQVEAEFGRERHARWAGRTLDIDLIAMGNLERPDRATQSAWRHLAPDQQALRAPGQLILPHPRLQDRAFVLVPLADVAANWRHPGLGKTVAQMLSERPESERNAVISL